MFRSKRLQTGHHYKNLKNKLQFRTNKAHDMGPIRPHKTYKVYTELYQIIGLVTPWTLNSKVMYKRMK
jgi:hypothetical protein